MYQIDEKLMADNRALISIQATKADVDKFLKNGMINYVSNTNDLYLTIPRSKDYGEYNRIVQEEPDGKIPYDLTFKGNITIEKDLLVLGSKTVIDTPSMTIEDNIIEINKNETGNGITLGSAGIQANRGLKGNSNWLFIETTDVPGIGAFVFDVNGSIKTWIYENGNVKTLSNFDTQKITAHNDIYGMTNLTIDGASLLKGTLTVNGATSLTNTLSVTGATTLNSSLTTVGATWLKNTLRVDGASTLNNTLSVVGNYATTLGGILTVAGASTINNTLHTTGAVDFDSTLNVDGAVSFQNTLTTVGATWLKNTLRVDQPATFNSTMTVVDDANFQDPVVMDETLNVKGAVDLDTTLNVDGAATFQNTVTVKGLTTIDGNNLYVKYDSIRGGGQLTVDKLATFNDNVSIIKNTTMGGTLNVTGAVSLASTLGVTGATNLTSLTATGVTNIQNTLTVSGATNINNTLAVLQGTNLKSTLDVTGATHLLSTLLVDGATTIDDTLHVIGAADFDSTMNVDGNVTIGGTLTTTGGSTLNGPVHLLNTLTVDMGTNLKSTLNVIGNTTATTATFSGAVDINNTLDVLGIATFSDNVNIKKALDVLLATSLHNTLAVDGDTLLKAKLTTNGATLLNNTLTVVNAATLQSTLSVTGSTTLLDTLTVTKSAVLNDTLSVIKNAAIGGTLGVTGATSLANTLDVTGATALHSTLTVDGASQFKNTVNIIGNLTASSATYSGPVSINNTLSVLTAANFLDVVDINLDLNVDRNVTIGGTLTTTRATYLNDILQVLGSTTLRDNLTVQKQLDVTLASMLHNNLTVEGDTVLIKNATTGNGGKLSVGGVATFNGVSTFNSNVVMNKPLTQNDVSTFNKTVTIQAADLLIQKTLTTGGNLTIDGHGEFNSTMNVDGNFTGTTATFFGTVTLADNLTVTKLSTFKDNATFEKNIVVNGSSSVTGASSVTSSLTVGGATTLNDTLLVQKLAVFAQGFNVTGTAAFNNNLTVTGTTTLNGALNANALATIAQLSVTGTSDFTGAVVMDSTLSVADNITASKNLTVTGTSSFTGAVSLLNSLTVNGTIWGKNTLTIDGATTLNNVTTINAATSINNTLTVTGDVKSTSNFSLGSGDGKGYRFWDNDSYKIYMSSSISTSRLDTTSDYNMYFRMAGGTNRGFVFQSDTIETFQIATDRVYSLNDVYVKNATGWTRLLRADEMGSGNSIDVDTVDGKHVDVDWTGTPNEIAMYNANNRVFDSDKIDGYHAGNASGQVPISNGVKNVNLNVDMIEGFHADVNATANTVVVRDASGDIKTAAKVMFNNFMLKDVAGALELRNAADTAWVDLVINNLTIKGTTTTVNSETVTVADNIMLLNSNVTGAATENAGIQIERGTTGADASMLWDESIDKWKCGIAGSEIEISLKGHSHVKTDITDFLHKNSHAIGQPDFLSPADIGAVKNAGNTPQMQTGLEADRPAAGTLGRIYLATDTKRIWQDMITQWQIIGGQDTIPWESVTGRPAEYVPQVASKTVLGGVIIGSNINVTPEGVISVSSNPDTFSIKREEYITYTGQTDFPLTKAPCNPGTNTVWVYLFGQKLPNSAFIEVSPTLIQLKEPVDSNSLIEIEYHHFIDLYPYPVHALEHLPDGQDPLPLATPTAHGWMDKADKSKLNGISPQAKKVESSTTNGNIKIDGAETQVYRHQTYVHDQTATASSLWVINHNLNRYPSVTVVDASGYVFIPDSVRYVDANRIEVGFTQNETGKVFLN